jgi:molecular chaperone GrpE
MTDGKREKKSKTTKVQEGWEAAAEAVAEAAASEKAATPKAGDTVARGVTPGEAPADERLAALAAERDEYLALAQRRQADFENYRKRVQRDNEELVLRAGEGLVESLLPVVDNMERALVAAAGHEANDLVEGVQLVAGQLHSVLVSHGLTEIPAEPGVPFDPTVHEAVMTQSHDEFPEGTIVAVVERGYLLHDKLLRPTRVIVAR